MATSRLYCGPQDFIRRLQQRMPMNVGFTFTEEQWDALSKAFGDRFDGRHAVDLRGRVFLPWSRYYLVFQAGRDRRLDRPRTPAAQVTRTAIDSFACGIALAGLAAGVAGLITRFLL